MKAIFTFDPEHPTEHTITVSTESSASSYGQAVVLSDGEPVDLLSWGFYRMLEASDTEVMELEAAGYPVTWAEIPDPRLEPIAVMFDPELPTRLFVALFGEQPDEGVRTYLSWLRAHLGDPHGTTAMPPWPADRRTGVVESVVATLTKLQFARVEYSAE